MTDELQVGVIGCGNMGKKHAGFFHRLDGVRVAAVCSRTQQSAERCADAVDAEAFDDLDTMLAKHRLDAVSICTPPYLHHDQAIRCFEAGAHVLCEKPLSHRVDQARAMAAAAETAERFLMTGFCYRFEGIMPSIKEAIDAGVIGRVTLYTCTSGRLASNLEGRWFGEPDKGGGLVAEGAVHFFDQIRWLAGEVANVSAHIATLGLDMQVEDTVLATFELDNGGLASVTCSWGAPGSGSYLAITGEKGTIERRNLPGEQDSAVIRDVHGNEVKRLHTTADNRVFLEVEHFVHVIRGLQEPRVLPADGVRATEIAAAVLESARTGKRVSVQDTPIAGTCERGQQK